MGLPIPTNRPARPATDPGPSRVLGYTSVLKHCLFSVTRHRQRTTRRARSRSGAGQTSSGRSNLGWAPPAGGGQATVVAPPARRAAPARRRLAPPGRRLGCSSPAQGASEPQCCGCMSPPLLIPRSSSCSKSQPTRSTSVLHVFGGSPRFSTAR